MSVRRFVLVLALAFECFTVGCVAELDPDAPFAVDGADDSLEGQAGLRATYFRNVDFTSVGLTRVDSVVDFDWGRNAPASGLPADRFSVRWEGFYVAQETGPHRFAVRSDDGMRLFVGDDDAPLVESWRNQAATTVRGTIDLVAGEVYPLRIEYFEASGAATIQLRCAPPSLPGGASEPLVPRTQLRTERPAAGMPVGSTPQRLVVAPRADAYVDAANPTTSFGLEPDLLVDRAPDAYQTMLRFDVPTLTAPVQRATLRLYVTNPSPDGPAVHVTTSTWSETRVTWETRPRAGTLVADPGNVAAGWLELDVTRAITRAGEISFLLVPEHDDGADFDSREGTRPPELVVVTGAAPSPTPPPSSRGITHVGTTQTYDSNGQGLVVERPSRSVEGDLLVLILHRTDDDLPLYVDGWTRVAECFKGDNGHACGTEAMCRRWHDDTSAADPADSGNKFCADFGSSGSGRDLAQAVFYRAVGSREPSSYRFDLNRDSTGHPGWAILTALRGADTRDPVRDWSGVGCDRDDDSLFPSVQGAPGDMLLLSQSFDDAVARERFLPPSGTELFGYVSRSDEAGFLFGGLVTTRGATGTKRTGGPGGPSCKDALVSLTIVAR